MSQPGRPKGEDRRALNEGSSSSKQEAGELRVERPQPGCVLVTLNRPHAKNALSLSLRRELVRTLAGLSDDPEIRAVVLTGAGDAFCAGLDMKELGSSADPRAAIVPEAESDPVLAITRFPWPVIAAINGAAITGGFELALACDVLLASTTARFADTHARIGVLPGWGLSQRLSRAIGAYRAKELSLTGNFIDAQRAEAWGLVNRIVAPEQLLPQALELAADMASTLPQTLLAYKQLIDDGLALHLAPALQLERARCTEWTLRLTSESLEQRRRTVLKRGRAQRGTG